MFCPFFRVVDDLGVVRHVGLEEPAELKETTVDGGGVESADAVDVLVDEVLLRQVVLDLVFEDLPVAEVGEAYPGPGHLVDVGGPDAAPGGADLPRAPQLLRLQVDGLVIGHDDVDVGAHLQSRADLDSPLVEGLQLLEKGLGIEDHAVAEAAELAPVQDAGGDEVENVLLRTGDDGVTGVVPSGVPDDDISVIGEEVNDFSLALITPLGTDNNQGRHEYPFINV